jgi:hypothetical protein
MSAIEWPVMAAISASVAPAIAIRVAAAPRRSWKVSPEMPALSQALPQDARNPS